MYRLWVLIFFVVPFGSLVSMERDGEWHGVYSFVRGGQDEIEGDEEGRGANGSALMKSVALGDDGVSFQQTPTDQKDGVAMMPRGECEKTEDTHQGSGWWGTLSSVGSFAVAPVHATKKVARRFRKPEHNLRRAVEDQDYERAKKVLKETAKTSQYDDTSYNGVNIFEKGDTRKNKNKSALEIALSNLDVQMVDLLLQGEHRSIESKVIYDFLFIYAEDKELPDQYKKKLEIMRLLVQKKEGDYYQSIKVNERMIPFVKLMLDTYFDKIKKTRDSDSLSSECKDMLNVILPFEGSSFCFCSKRCECQFRNSIILTVEDSSSGQTALMSVAKNGNLALLSHLLAIYKRAKEKDCVKGLSIDTKDFKGRTALWHAVKHLHTQTVKRLIDHGADKNIDRDNLTLEEFIRSRLELVSRRMQHAQEKLKQNETNKKKNAANVRKGLGQQLPILAVYQVESLEKDKQRYKATQDKLKKIQKELGFKARIFE